MNTEVVLWIVRGEVEVAGELVPQRLDLALSSLNRFPWQALQWQQLKVQRCLFLVTDTSLHSLGRDPLLWLLAFLVALPS